MFDLNTVFNDASPGTKRSLIIDAAGKILYSSDNNVGFRVAYLEPDEDIRENERSERYESVDREKS